MTTAALDGHFRDVVLALADAGADYLIVGGHAVAHHGHVRTTLDFDVLVRPTPANARKVVEALTRFGAPLREHGVGVDDFAIPGNVYQVGLPPRRIDVLTSIGGVDFDDAWATRSSAVLEGRTIWFIGLDALIRNKRAVARKKDLLDAAALERTRAGRGASRPRAPRARPAKARRRPR